MKLPSRWLWLLALVPIVLGLIRLRFDVEVLNLLPQDSRAVQGLKLYQQHFANARELLITVRATDAERAENAAHSIAEQLRRETALVASVLWQPPWLEHPEQSGELIAYLWLNQPPAVFSDLASRLEPSKVPEQLAATREQLATSLSPDEIARLSYDPFGLTRLPESATGATPAFGPAQNIFSSADGTLRIIFVQANRDLPTFRDCAQWLSAIQRAVTHAMPATSSQTDHVAIGYTGRPAFVTEISAGMEHDITLSVGGTAAIIAVLFWLAHRRWKPMLWLLMLLALILGATLALGGLIFGAINVVSMGFAAILLGLAVDYAVVHYQEALAHPNLSVPEIRRAIAPSIFWAAVTTICAFLVLNLGGLPGLAQLGSLVGLGVAISACIMIFAFLPPLFPERRSRAAMVSNPAMAPFQTHAPPTRQPIRGGFFRPALRLSPQLALGLAGALAVIALIILAQGLPTMDTTADPLRPRNSAAYAALEDVKTALNQKREPHWLLIAGHDEAEVARRLDDVRPALERAMSNSAISAFTLPTALWPHPDRQAANRDTAQKLLGEREILRHIAQTNGFAESALGLAESILNTWATALRAPGVFWPTNEMSRWIFDRFVARTPTNLFALGLLQPATKSGPSTLAALAAFEAELPSHDVWLSGWELLGTAIFSSVKRNLWKLLSPMICLVLLSLALAFRRPREVFLSLAVLALSGLCLLAFMRIAHWRWNLLNLMALPLILGTGVDYSIFMQLALRRYHGDLQMAYRSVGRALLLCGATATAGFGSLGFSNNAGMASLGQLCALGIALNMLISIFLLPYWWANFERANSLTNPQSPSSDAPPSTPSSLYRAEIWRFGLFLVRLLPRRLCMTLAPPLGQLYWILARRRREVVIENLAGVLGERNAAAKTGRALLRQFAVKLVDLWRYEAGLPIEALFGEATGWEHFVAAQSRKCGVLLLTVHLGDWEFGAPWLARRGVPLQVITLAEPGPGFTKLRQASRARANIETLVINDDPFAFVEIIRRLESGATVALLVDRPPSSSSIQVELFGHPFAASIAAAELARVSGCTLLPVYLPRIGDSYAAHVLPAVPYDRPSLRDREARRRLTQQIMSAFEPAIRYHLDQWYHFVPIWPKE